MNILHSISKSRITPEHFLACVEIPAGSKNKYELDVETGALILDRILYTATHYPQNYGFIPRTWSLDEDPLDVLVICSQPIVPMSLVRAYPVAVLNMIDSGEVDQKSSRLPRTIPCTIRTIPFANFLPTLSRKFPISFSIIKNWNTAKTPSLKGCAAPNTPNKSSRKRLNVITKNSRIRSKRSYFILLATSSPSSRFLWLWDSLA